jgi:nucleoid-associated protein YgaU
VRGGCGGRARGGSGAVRLTAAGRRAAVALALAVGFALAAAVGAALDGDDAGLRLVGESSVVVRPGDTLWEIARTVAGDGDVRPVVDEIQRLNGLDDAAGLVPGQILVLP